jgi:hypothetical protein
MEASLSTDTPFETGPAKEDYATARSYAWEWFKLHATQRMTVFNFFLLIAAAILTGLLTTIEKGQYYSSLSLCVIAVVTIFFFSRLDRRNAQLVKLAES